MQVSFFLCFNPEKNIPPHWFVESRKDAFPLFKCVEGPCKKHTQIQKHLVACLSWHKLTFLRSSEINRNKKNFHFLSLLYLEHIFFWVRIYLDLSLTAGGETAESICVERKKEIISFWSCKANFGRANVISQPKKCLREQKLPALFLDRVLRTLINSSDQHSSFKYSLEVWRQ